MRVDPPVAVVQQRWRASCDSAYPAAPFAVRAGTSSPRRFSRETEERTDGASTPTAFSNRISSATGSGVSPGVRPYAP